MTKDSNGVMKIEIKGTDSSDITLQYGSTFIDNIGLGVTIVGAAIYLFIFLVNASETIRSSSRRREKFYRE